jgi:acylphosphatase
MSDDERAVRVRVTGRVQGVYFRGWTLEQAERLHLSGWVRNEADGSVAALVVGRRVDVDKLLHAMRSGPPGAEVGEVSVQDVTPESRPEGFAVTG